MKLRNELARRKSISLKFPVSNKILVLLSSTFHQLRRINRDCNSSLNNCIEESELPASSFLDNILEFHYCIHAQLLKLYHNVWLHTKHFKIFKDIKCLFDTLYLEEVLVKTQFFTSEYIVWTNFALLFVCKAKLGISLKIVLNTEYLACNLSNWYWVQDKYY